MPRFGTFPKGKMKGPMRKRAKPKIRTKKKDPIFIDGNARAHYLSITKTWNF